MSIESLYPPFFWITKRYKCHQSAAYWKTNLPRHKKLSHWGWQAKDKGEKKRNDRRTKRLRCRVGEKWETYWNEQRPLRISRWSIPLIIASALHCRALPWCLYVCVACVYCVLFTVHSLRHFSTMCSRVKVFEYMIWTQTETKWTNTLANETRDLYIFVICRTPSKSATCQIWLCCANICSYIIILCAGPSSHVLLPPWCFICVTYKGLMYAFGALQRVFQPWSLWMIWHSHTGLCGSSFENFLQCCPVCVRVGALWIVQQHP